jgi:hypothetical protein
VQADKRFVGNSICMESVLSLITQAAYLPDGMEKLLSWGVEGIIVSGMSASGVAEVRWPHEAARVDTSGPRSHASTKSPGFVLLL